MIDQTQRFVIEIPAGDTKVELLKPLFAQLASKIHDNSLRRLKSAKICGQFYDGKDRAALLVGNKVEEQIEYVNQGEHFKINTTTDLKTLYVVSTDGKPVNAVIVLQF